MDKHFENNQQTPNPISHILDNLNWDDLIDINFLNQWVQEYQGTIFVHSESAIDAVVVKDRYLIGNGITPIYCLSYFKDSSLFNVSISKLSEIVLKLDREIVAVSHLDANWGYLSSSIQNRTAQWESCPFQGKATKELFDSIFSSKHHVFVSQHRPFYVDRPNIFNIPIGFDGNHVSLNNIKQSVIENQRNNRDNLLACNCALASQSRQDLFHNINKNFDNNLVNSKNAPDYYFRELSSSKFCLCLSGIGYESYRVWESILFGCIPIVENNTINKHGLNKLFDHFPILQVDNFEFINPQILERHYEELKYEYQHSNYELLTNQYWIKRFSQTL